MSRPAEKLDPAVTQNDPKNPIRKRSATPKVDKQPRQNHGAKLERLKQYLEIKVGVMESMGAAAEGVAAYRDVLNRINTVETK